MLKWLTNIFNSNDKEQEVQNLTHQDYSGFDFVHLTELYYKNKWLSNNANHRGFEDLWFDCSNDIEKIILKRLINNFAYVEQEDAKIKSISILEKCIKDWCLKPEDTRFIAFKIEEYADGSSIALNFIRPIMANINPNWKTKNFIGDIHRGKRRIKDENLKNIVLVDDFVGTGGTAKNRINTVKKEIEEKSKDINIFVFSLGGMKSGKKKIESCKIKFACTYLIDKGTALAFPQPLVFLARSRILKMEKILDEGSEKLPLNKFSLGYEKSEALYSWNVFNIPNNNYPIFWWNKYKGGKKRTTIFTRSH